MACGTLLTVTSLTIIFLSGVHSGVVTKCKSDDSKCIKEAAQAMIPLFAKGMPEHQVKALDPMIFKRMDASSANLKLFLTDVTLTGLKDSVMKKLKRDKPKNKLFVKLLCNVQLESQYEMSGQLLILPINGKGPLHVTLKNLELSIEADIDEIQKNGVTHWNVKDWKHTYALKDKSNVVFENLFNGNEVLAQAAREVISSSGNEIIHEAGPVIIKSVAGEVVKNVNNFFHSVPAQELSLD